MTKKLLAIIALVLLGSPIAAQAQTVTFLPVIGGQPTPQCDLETVMLTCVDWVHAQDGVIAGWSVDRNTGRIPLSVQLYKMDGQPQMVAYNYSVVVPRPDVAAYVGTTNTQLGWGIVVGQPLATGTYALLVTDVPYSQTCGVYANTGQMWCGWQPNMIEFTVR